MADRTRWVVAVLIPAAASVLAAGAGQAQEFTQDRLRLLPAQVNFGVESTRLQGMGGFSTAVRDANYRIDLWDFSGNPAGYGDYRDSWVVELDYNHEEYAERDRREKGNDIFINEGTLAGGYYSPKSFGIGATMDYAEVSGTSFAQDSDQINVLNLDITGNRYVSRRLTIGLNLGYGTETEDGFDRSVYNINHDALTVRGGVGAAYVPVDGVVVGARCEGIGNTVNGISQGPFHEDNFDWSRPGFAYGFQGFVNRGRLTLGVDASGRNYGGRESVRTSWSERFGFNPGGDFVVQELETISEDRSKFAVRARGLVAVGAGIEVAGSVLTGTESFTVIANPNAIGSLPGQDVDIDASVYGVGATWTGLSHRLLLALEGEFGGNDVTDNTAGVKNSLDHNTFRVGGEYFLSEIVTGRAGLSVGSQDLALEDNPDLTGTYSETALSVGLGLLPRGGIWQFDLSLTQNLSSDLDNKNTVFGSYVKYLF